MNTAASPEIDYRGRETAEVGRAVIAYYNRASPNERFTMRLDEYGPGLRIGLLEAGARHRAHELADGGWRLEIERGLSPAQGSIPGVHHVAAEGDSVWACERAHRVARIDPHSGRVIAVADVARCASHFAVDAGRDRLFVADAEANAMVAVRASDLRVEQTWEAPGRPQLPLVNPEGIVCVTGGRESGTLTIARPRRNAYTAQTIEVGRCPHDPVLTVDGGHLFVPCAGAAELVKVRLADGAIVGRCPAGDGPSHLARHPDGSRIYAANSWDGTLTCVTVDGERVGQVRSGGWAHAIDIAPDGRWVYVANFMDDTLAVFDAATLERAALLETEAYPHGLDVSPDGRHVVATGFNSDYLRIYGAQDPVEIARVEVGRGSSHTAFLGGFAYVGCSVSDHVARVDVAARRCVAQLRLDG